MTPSTPLSAAELDLDYDFEESIGYWTVLAAQAYQKALNDELAPHGITFRQSQVLGWLILAGELSQVELATRMMIEPATLVGVLDRMQRNQWISREISSHDRRRNVIRINPQARDIWKQVATCAREVRGRAVVGLSKRQVSALNKTMRAVIQNLS